MLIENLELTHRHYEKLLDLAEKERISIKDILLRAVDFYISEMVNEYDLEDVTDSIKRAFIDIRDGRVSPIEEVLDEL